MTDAILLEPDATEAADDGDCLMPASNLNGAQVQRLEVTITDSKGKKFTFFAYKLKSKTYTKDEAVKEEWFTSDQSRAKFKKDFLYAILRSIANHLKTMEDAFGRFPLGEQGFLRSFASEGELIDVMEVPMNVLTKLQRQVKENNGFHVVLGLSHDAVVKAMEGLTFEKKLFHVTRTDPKTNEEKMIPVLAWSEGNAEYITPVERRVVRAVRKAKQSASTAP